MIINRCRKSILQNLLSICDKTSQQSMCAVLGRSVMSDSLRPQPQLAGLLCLWDSPGKNAGVGGLPLLQTIFSTQESNQGLSDCRQILYQLSYQRSP